jgi:type II secretory pathway predicted ATPase ExeA
MEHFDERFDELDAQQRALRDTAEQIQKTLTSIDDRLIVATAFAQATMLALTKQRKVNTEKLIDDFESGLHAIFEQLGRRDLMQSVIVPPVPKKLFL